MTKELLEILDERMKLHAANALQGVPCVLGTMTSSGVLLDNFKHEVGDPMVHEPLIDGEIEVELYVPAHEETGKLKISNEADIPVTPTGATGEAPIGYIKKGEHIATFIFDDWTYDAAAKGFIKITQARIKYKPEYKAGDRVLCALVNGGQDAVIISRVVPYG